MAQTSTEPHDATMSSLRMIVSSKQSEIGNLHYVRHSTSTRTASRNKQQDILWFEIAVNDFDGMEEGDRPTGSVVVSPSIFPLHSLYFLHFLVQHHLSMHTFCSSFCIANCTTFLLFLNEMEIFLFHLLFIKLTVFSRSLCRFQHSRFSQFLFLSQSINH